MSTPPPQRRKKYLVKKQRPAVPERRKKYVVEGRTKNGFERRRYESGVIRYVKAKAPVSKAATPGNTRKPPTGNTRKPAPRGFAETPAATNIPSHSQEKQMDRQELLSQLEETGIPVDEADGASDEFLQAILSVFQEQEDDDEQDQGDEQIDQHAEDDTINPITDPAGHENREAGGAVHDQAVRDMMRSLGAQDHEINRMSDDERYDHILAALDAQDERDARDAQDVEQFSEGDREIRVIGQHYDAHADVFGRHNQSKGAVIHAYIAARRREPTLSARAFLKGR